MSDAYSGVGPDYDLVPVEHNPFDDVGAGMARHLTGNPSAGPGQNPAQAFLDWRNSGQSWADQYHDYSQRAQAGPQAAIEAAGNPMDLFGGFVGQTMDMPLFHGSPVAGLSTLKSSTRGPLGPGVYTSPAEQIANSYAGESGTLYQLPQQQRDIFLGIGHRTDDQWFGFKQDKQRLIDAAEPDKKDAVAGVLEKMWSNDGYPAYQRIAQLYGGDEPAQALFKRAGFQGVSGLVDGPEVLLFGDQSLKPGITAYHGSPYDFSKFDISKIGTGEGAQAYGHGLYFAENPKVAADYKNKLAPGALGVAPDEVASAKFGPQWDALVQQRRALQNGDLRVDTSSVDSKMDDLHQQMVDDTIARNPQLAKGRMYQVSIAADPEHFLDWDKPLSEQHPAIKDTVLKSLGAETPTLVGQGPNGRWLTMDEKGNVIGRQDGWPDQGTARDAARVLSQDAERMLSKSPGDLLKTPSQAINMDRTEQLRQAGIPGIKYLDQGSRNAGAVTMTTKYRDVRIDNSNDTAERFLAARYQQNGGDIGRTVQHLQSDLSGHPDDATVQKALNLAQAPDAKFNWDQSAQTHNFVVFDDSLISILKKYGIAGLIAGGASHFSTTPVDHNPYASGMAQGGRVGRKARVAAILQRHGIAA